MPDEKLTPQEQEWLKAQSEADVHRSYRPIQGMDEPAQAPPGRASASLPEGDTGQGEDKGTEDHAAPD
jgi:hypothetical protein